MKARAGAAVNDDDIEKAVAEGVISPEQARRMRQIRSGDAARDQLGEEPLKFIGSFHDVFIATGVLLFWIGLSIAVAQWAGPAAWTEAMDVVMLWVFAGLNTLAAGVMWVGAEYFARAKRRLLPSIVLFLAYFSFSMSAIVYAYGALFTDTVRTMDFDQEGIDSLTWLARLTPAIVISLAAGAGALFYTRFRLPFAMGVLGATGVAAVLALVFALAPHLIADRPAVTVFLSGAAILALGIAFDVQDPERRTRLSDNGFWLHFIAAPLILNGALWTVNGGFGAMQDREAFSGASAATTLLVVGALAVISLLINRRALVVAGLISAGISIGILMNEAGLEGVWVGAATLLSLGGAVVLLGAGWHGVRRLLTAPFPKTGPIARLVPPVTVDG